MKSTRRWSIAEPVLMAYCPFRSTQYSTKLIELCFMVGDGGALNGD